MARLARCTLSVGGGMVALAVAGCATTQQQAARLRLVSARDRATEEAVIVTRADPAVAARAALVRSAGGTAIVVRLRNLSGRTVSDLPITVGLRAGGRERVLNRGAGLDYFLTHIPGIGPYGRLIWVYPSGRRPPKGIPVVRVGFPGAGPGTVSATAGTLPATLPRLDVSLGRMPSDGRIDLVVRNLSDIPQYGLPVYAAAERRDGYTAAARGAIGELDGGSTQRLRLVVLGNPRGSAVIAQAGPTELR